MFRVAVLKYYHTLDIHEQLKGWGGGLTSDSPTNSYLPQNTRHVLITKCIPHHVFLQQVRDGVSLKASGNHHDRVRVFKCSEQDRYKSVVFMQTALRLIHTSTTSIYVHVTLHRNKFLYNKTNQMHQFPKFTPA